MTSKVLQEEKTRSTTTPPFHNSLLRHPPSSYPLPFFTLHGCRCCNAVLSSLTAGWCTVSILTTALYAQCHFALLESQTRELDTIHALLPLIVPLFAVELIALGSGDSCGKRSFDSYSSWQRSSATETGGCGGRLETCPTFQTCRCRSASSTRHSLTR